jgi:hypothetical protein
MSRKYQRDQDWREREGRNREGDNFPSRDDQFYMNPDEGRSRRDEQGWRGQETMGSGREREGMRRPWGQEDQGYDRQEDRGQQRFGNTSSFGQRENYGYNSQQNREWGQFGEPSGGRGPSWGHDEGAFGGSRFGGGSSRQAGSDYEGMSAPRWNEGTGENQGRQGQTGQGQFTGRGPRNYKRGDDRIEEDINERLTQHGTIDATDIEVTVQNGEVTLKGHVDNRQAKRLAEEVAESVSGVKDVNNQIKVQQNRGESSGESQTSGKSQQRKAS